MTNTSNLKGIGFLLLAMLRWKMKHKLE